MTDRLYYRDSYLAGFSANATEVNRSDKGTEVILDRTAFYPEGGGQPFDLGEIAGAPVVGVLDRDGEVVHLVDGKVEPGPVEARVEWGRRFDHMQQHSGQHILSQAFERLLGARTVSFHMGPAISNVDLAVPALTSEEVARVEDLANQVVFENRPIKVHMADPSDLDRFELRRGTERTGEIRIVEVDGFDSIPCGGTHCRTAGEIGVIKVIRWEKKGGNSRVEFLCGERALADYRMKNESVVDLAAKLSVKDRELSEAVDRLIQESTESRRLAGYLRNRLMDYEAEALVQNSATPIAGGVAVSAMLADRGPEDLKHLAERIVSEPGRAVLLASASERTNLVFARSADLTFDASALLKKVIAPLGGRGGGRPNIAQGGVPDPSAGESLLQAALRDLQEMQRQD